MRSVANEGGDGGAGARSGHPRFAGAASRLVPVAAGELPSALDDLFAHHLELDFFGDRFDGMRRLTDDESEFEVQLVPNRTATPIARKLHDVCALCDPPDPRERGLDWRGYTVWPNAYPYVAADRQQVVIATRAHVGQGFSPELLADMVTYQREATRDEPPTLHYNGIAGNTQFHLHWQASRGRVPLERRLDSGELAHRALHEAPHGAVLAFDQSFYAGLVVTGNDPYVLAWSTVIMRELDREPSTRGAYNLLLLGPGPRGARLAIIPRRHACLKPRLSNGAHVVFGAYSMAGVMVVPLPSVPDGFHAEVLAAARATVVRPSELAWLTPAGLAALEPGR